MEAGPGIELGSRAYETLGLPLPHPAIEFLMNCATVSLLYGHCVVLSTTSCTGPLNLEFQKLCRHSLPAKHSVIYSPAFPV